MKYKLLYVVKVLMKWIITWLEKHSSTFLQRDTDEEVKEHLRNNLHLQEKVI